MKRYHIIVEGLVQGVGFRWYVLSIANKYFITGTVKNLSNGMVEVFAQGHERDLDIFLHALETGSHYSRVENISYKVCPVKENESRFEVIY